jgi:hypothetical protein
MCDCEGVCSEGVENGSETEQQKSRKNGLEGPYHYLQVATWFLFPLIIVHFFAFLMQIFWESLAAKIVLTLSFCISVVVSGWSWHQTASTNPADDCVLSATGLDDPSNIYCYLCKSAVHSTSKHCRYCNKCIVGFDHHCKWLNTCIGTKNYKYFLVIVGSVTFLTTESLALSIALLVESYAHAHIMQKRLNNHAWNTTIADDVPLDAVRGVLIGSVALLAPLVVMVYQLAIFHAGLVWQGITTYDFIVQEQRKQREKDAEKQKQRREKAAAAQAAAQGSKPQPLALRPVVAFSSVPPRDLERGGGGSGEADNDDVASTPSIYHSVDFPEEEHEDARRGKSNSGSAAGIGRSSSDSGCGGSSGIPGVGSGSNNNNDNELLGEQGGERSSGGGGGLSSTVSGEEFTRLVL